METEDFIHPISYATEEVKTEPCQEPEFALKIDAVFSLADASEEYDHTSIEQAPNNNKSSEDSVMHDASLELVNHKSEEEEPVMPDLQKIEKCVNNEGFDVTTPPLLNSEKDLSDVLDKTEEIPQTNNKSAGSGNDIRKTVTFHPCFVCVDDVMEHHVMKTELARLRTIEENLKKKQERQKELEEIKTKRRKALRGYNSRVFAPFVEDPEEIIKKKLDISKQIQSAEEKIGTEKKKCNVNKSETETAVRRSLRRRNSNSDANYHDNNPVSGDCKSDIEKQINSETIDANACQDSSMSDCRPSRKRKVSKLLSGNSFIVDVREMKTVWQENIKMEKNLQAEQEKRQNKINGSVYRLYYGRQQTAKTKTKLNLKRREDMPFLSIKLNKKQVSGICERQYNSQSQSTDLSSTDLNMLPLYVRTDIKMEETSRGTYKIWRLHKPKTKEKNNVKNKRKTIQDKQRRKFTEEDIAHQKPLKKKETCNLVNSEANTQKEESKTVYENNPSERVPCSLVGRCRKPYSRYSSEYVTNFKGNWKQDLKMATAIKTENNADDSSSEMTDSASETQEIESRDVSPCKEIKSEIQTSPEMQTIQEMQNKKHIVHPPVRTAPDQNAVTNSKNVPVAPNVTTAGITLAGETLKNYPSGFMNTVAHLAKEQNTKKFFQITIGDKIVLIPTDGSNVIPKAFVMDSMNPIASCINQGQNVHRQGTPNPTPFVSNVGIPPQRPVARLNTPIVTAKIPPDVSSYRNIPVMKDTAVRFPTPTVTTHLLPSPRLPTPFNTPVAKLPPLIPKPVSTLQGQGTSSQVFMPASAMLSSLSTAAMPKQTNKQKPNTTANNDNVSCKSMLSKPSDNYTEMCQPNLTIPVQQSFDSRVNQLTQGTISAQHAVKSECEEKRLFEMPEKLRIENEMNIMNAETQHSVNTERSFVNTSQNAFNGIGNKASSEVKYEKSYCDLKTNEMKIGIVNHSHLVTSNERHITEVEGNSTDNQSFNSNMNTKTEIGVTKKTEEIKRICSTETDDNCREKKNTERNYGEETALPLRSVDVPFSKFLGDVIVSEINRYKENDSSGPEAVSSSLVKNDKNMDNKNACKVVEHSDLGINQGKVKGEGYEGHQNNTGSSHVADRNVDSHTIDHGFAGGRDLTVQNVSDSSVVDHGDGDINMAEQHSVDSHAVKQEIVDSHMAAEQEIVGSHMAEQNNLAEQHSVDSHAVKQEIVYSHMAAEQEIVGSHMAEQNNLVEHHSVDSHAVKQEIVDSHMAEQHSVDSHAVKQEIVDSHMAAEQEIVGSHMAEQNNLAEQHSVDSHAVKQEIVDSHMAAEQEIVGSHMAEQNNLVEQHSVDSHAVKQEIVDSHVAEQHSVDSHAVKQEIVDSHMAAEQEIVGSHMAEQNIVDYSITEQDIVNDRVVEQDNDNFLPQQDIADNRMAEQDIADNCMAEQDSVDRMEEQEIGDTHMTKQSDGDSRLTEKGEGILSLEDRFPDKSFIKTEVPDIEYVTYVPVNESVAEERIRKLREKLRAKQAELENFRKNVHLRSDTEQGTS